jgi:phosphonate transport system substrate-binding protein
MVKGLLLRIETPGGYSRTAFLLFFLLFFLFFPALPLYAGVSYTFATYPVGDPEKMYRAFDPLVRFIASETGWTMRAAVTRNYEEMTERLADGSVHIAFYSSASYVAFGPFIEGLTYVATYAEQDGKGRLLPYYHSAIIALKSESIADLDDLKGTAFAFTDRQSTSGYRIPLLMMREKGIEPEHYFRKIFFLGRHDSVIEALRAGSVQGGAVSDGTLNNAVARYGGIFEVLALSDPIPLDAVVASPCVPPEHVEILRNILVSLTPDSPVVRNIREHTGWPAAGFVVLGDEFYEPLRRAMESEAPEEKN